ncbi:MAG: hypothetical protein ACD_43C00286G0007 [uncultured bacterium]|nr:MAG: hypothetical protein ACD_43C00286G0007 [uncultured bacterium]
MDIHLIIASLTVISTSILAYLLAKSGGLRNRSRLLFFFFLVDFIIWTIFNYLSLQPDLAKYTLWIVRVIMVSALTHTTLIYLFAKNFPYREFILPKKLAIGIGLTYILTFLVSISPLLFSKVIWQDDVLRDVSGPGIYVFGIVTFFLISAATVTLIKKYKTEHGITKKQLLYLLMGEIIMFSLLFVTQFVMVVWFNIYYFIPYGGLPVLFFIALTTYAITRYRLFGIKFILRKFIITALSYIAPLVLYGLLLLVLSETAPQFAFHNNYINILVVAMVVVTFNPIRSFVHKLFTVLLEHKQEIRPELTQAIQSGQNEEVINQMIKQYVP